MPLAITQVKINICEYGVRQHHSNIRPVTNQTCDREKHNVCFTMYDIKRTHDIIETLLYREKQLKGIISYNYCYSCKF